MNRLVTFFRRFEVRVGLGVLTAFLLVAGFIIYRSVQSRIDYTYADAEIWTQQAPIPSDTLSQQKGALVAKISGCRDCHGPNLAGKVFMDNAVAYIAAPNLTADPASAVAKYTDADWLLAIKHGLRHDSRGLWVMPSTDYEHMTNQDCADLIEYLENLPPDPTVWPERKLKPLGYLLVYFNQLPVKLLAAEAIDHHQAAEPDVKEGVTVGYGNYLAASCRGCHGPNLKGAMGPNISGSGEVGKWTDTQFQTLLHTGKTPDGRALDNHKMPWDNYSSLDDTQMRALLLYLKSK